MTEELVSQEEESILDDVELEEDEIQEPIEDDEDDVEVQPETYSLDWTPWVLSQLADDEFFNGNPKVDGLRRIANKILGDIVESKTELQFSPSGKMIAAVVTVTFNNNGSFHRISGAADAGDHSLDEKYKKYPAAMAETRAEGRALRKALRLKGVVASEEIAEPPRSVNDKPISDSQKTIIGVIAERAKVDVEKMTKRQFGNRIGSINELSSEQASRLITELNEYQRNSSVIPQSIKNYNPTWRETFNV
jgi:hypothetical protein